MILAEKITLFWLEKQHNFGGKSSIILAGKAADFGGKAT
jgi:hypothetical protein